MDNKAKFYDISNRQELSIRKPNSTSKCLQPNSKLSKNTPYIPGLTKPPPEPEKPAKLTPKEVDPQLIDDFLSGEKHPVSSIMEYCAALRLTATFRDTLVESYSSQAAFASICTVDGRDFPQGTGRTKKEAKTNAAKIAFTSILGLETDDVEANNETGQVIYDTHGRKMLVANTELNSSPAVENVIQYEDVINSESPQFNFKQSALEELQKYCQRKHEILSFDITNTEKGYQAVLKINGDAITTATDSTAKEAKNKAAEASLVIVSTFAQDFKETEEIVPHYDKVEQLCYSQFLKVVGDLQSEYSPLHDNFASFVIKRDEQDDGTVVAFGTGAGCCSATSLVSGCADGRVLHDCHSVVIARRSLMKYFYKELTVFYSKESVLSIFTEDADSSKLKLKPTVSLHLYLSSAPCGDCDVYSLRKDCELNESDNKVMYEGIHEPDFSQPQHAFLRVKGLMGSDCVLLNSISPGKSVEDIKMNNILYTMSCSDKLLKWNICGLQGSLLSHFVSPVYMSSVTLGRQFDPSHLCRAICCRAADDELLPYLPENFKLNHPYLGRVRRPILQKSKCKHPQHSLNWSQSQEQRGVEIIDTCSGRSLPFSPVRCSTSPNSPSQLCPASFFSRFKKLAKLTKKFNLLQCSTYHDAKVSAVEYHQTKIKLFKYLEKMDCGHWYKKPKQLNMFTQ